MLITLPQHFHCQVLDFKNCFSQPWAVACSTLLSGPRSFLPAMSTSSQRSISPFSMASAATHSCLILQPEQAPSLKYK